jgi:FKBP-type peptidyl-prolyl cis-trans isomerase 2
LACSDHIKELIIVHSSPNYVPKQDDLASGLAVDGNKMKIEVEPYDMFGMKSQNNYQSSNKKSLQKPKLNQKAKGKNEE